MTDFQDVTLYMVVKRGTDCEELQKNLAIKQLWEIVADEIQGGYL